MPNYDFKCNFCGTIVEIQDNVAPNCAFCGSITVRVWTAPGIQFNSPGFYSTGG